MLKWEVGESAEVVGHWVLELECWSRDLVL